PALAGFLRSTACRARTAGAPGGARSRLPLRGSPGFAPGSPFFSPAVPSRAPARGAIYWASGEAVNQILWYRRRPERASRLGSGRLVHTEAIPSMAQATTVRGLNRRTRLHARRARPARWRSLARSARRALLVLLAAPLVVRLVVGAVLLVAVWSAVNWM